MNRLEALAKGALATVLALTLAGAATAMCEAAAAPMQQEQTSLQASHNPSVSTVFGTAQECVPDMIQTATEATEAALPTTGELAVATAYEYEGTPYAYGGSSPAGFDCSGFTMYVYGTLV